MENFIKIIESNFFANVCQFFSAVGTIGAVIISLFLSYSKNSIKIKIHCGNCNMLSLNQNRKQIAGYSATICNCSNDKNVYLKDCIYVKHEKKDKEKTHVLLPVYELGEKFIAPKILGPGEDYMFFISEKHIKWLLENCNIKRIKLYFMDKSNRKFYFKISREDLEKELETIEINRDNILAL